MREVGRIALLQVLQSAVKLGEGFNTYSVIGYVPILRKESTHS